MRLGNDNNSSITPQSLVRKRINELVLSELKRDSISGRITPENHRGKVNQEDNKHKILEEITSGSTFKLHSSQ